MSEFNAALGLLQLRHIDFALNQRKKISAAYELGLEGVKGISCLSNIKGHSSNHSYFPILISDEYSLSRDQLYKKLKEHNIHTRRYFYPLISELPMYKNLPSAIPNNLPIATRIAKQVLCLPIYPELSSDSQDRIIEIIRTNK